MQYPIEVILQRCESSTEIEASVFEAISRLEQLCDQILGCQVFIRCPSASDNEVYVVSLRVRTPDAGITITGGRQNCPEHRELRRALDLAIAQAAHELQELRLPLCTCSGAARAG